MSMILIMIMKKEKGNNETDNSVAHKQQWYGMETLCLHQWVAVVRRKGLKTYPMQSFIVASLTWKAFFFF